eukprot:5080195-Pleurochrysis_carterae.AAC.1
MLHASAFAKRLLDPRARARARSLCLRIFTSLESDCDADCPPSSLRLEAAFAFTSFRIAYSIAFPCCLVSLTSVSLSR